MREERYADWRGIEADASEWPPYEFS